MEKKTQTVQESGCRSEEISMAQLIEEQEKSLIDFFEELERSFDRKPIILVVRGFGMVARVRLINEVRRFIQEHVKHVIFDFCELGLIMQIDPDHNILITDNSIMCDEYTMRSLFDMRLRHGEISLIISFAKQNAKRFEDLYQDFPLISTGKSSIAVKEVIEIPHPHYHSFLVSDIFDMIGHLSDVYNVYQLVKLIILIIKTIVR